MRFSIVTTCKNRLSHLKESLPAMLAQEDAEVIVVDFSCAEGTAAFVRAHHPRAKVVEVPGRDTFSNWEARNKGAAAATGDWLVFVDADIMLSAGCVAWLRQNMVSGKYGKFKPGKELERHRSTTSALSLNNLQGFLVVERAAFEKTGGYDELLRGWGAGGDVDIQNALHNSGTRKSFLPEHIVARVVEHDDTLRFAHTGGTFRKTFLQNLIYRELKRFLFPIFGVPMSLEVREKVYAAAVKAAANAKGKSNARADVILSRRPVEMRRRLGHPEAEIQISLRALVDHLTLVPGDEGDANRANKMAGSADPQAQ